MISRAVEIRGVGYNLKVGRPPARVVAEVRHLLRTYRPDLFTYCEGPGYTLPLERQLPRWELAGFPFSRSSTARETGLILDPDRIELRRVRLVRLERRGWSRKPSNRHLGPHPPRGNVAARLRVEGLPLAAVSVHLPPAGDRSREIAQATSLRTLARRARYWNRRGIPWLMPGDWNLTRRELAPWAARLGAAVTGHGIDLVVSSRGVRIRDFVRIGYGGSDHNPFTYRAEILP